VAYRIHHDVDRGRWYVTASWQRPSLTTIPLQAALAKGVVGVDTNNDHLAAWQLDIHGNPIGAPRRFSYDLFGDGRHRPTTTRAIVMGIGPPRPHQVSQGVRDPAPHGPGPRTRCAPPDQRVNAGDQHAHHRSGRASDQEPTPAH
jgi:hypothetical protein